MGYRLATIQKAIKPSDETQSGLFNKANTLAINAQGKSANEFINAARKEGGQVNNSDGITRFESNLVGLEGTRKEGDILRWAFNEDTKAGSVQSFETATGGQIVAYLSNKYGKDEYNVAAARTTVEPLVRNQKILDKISAETSGADLNTVASKYGAAKISASVNFARPTIEGAGVEPKLGGVALGLGEGKTSGAIKGNQGIYFVKLVKKGAVQEAPDMEMARKNLQVQTKSQISGGIIQSLVDAADIDDNRVEKLK